MKKKKYPRPVTEPEKIAVAKRLIRKVMRTLESNGLIMSKTDRDDAMQAGMLGLVKAGFFESGIVTKHSFRAISREIESRSCLRLNAQWETTTEPQILEEIGIFHEYEERNKFDKKTILAIRSCFSALRATAKLSESRKAKFEWRINRDFLTACIANSTGKGKFHCFNPATFRSRKHKFLAYLQKGARALHAQRNKHHTLAGEILHNLERNFITA